MHVVDMKFPSSLLSKIEPLILKLTPVQETLSKELEVQIHRLTSFPMRCHTLNKDRVVPKGIGAAIKESRGF